MHFGVGDSALGSAAAAQRRQRQRSGGSSSSTVAGSLAMGVAAWQQQLGGSAAAWRQRWQLGRGGQLGSSGGSLATAQLQWQQPGVMKLEYFGTYLQYLPTNPTSQHCDSDLDIRSHFLSHDFI
jgi:hypothetical protein